MNLSPARDKAITLIAACDTPDAGPCEREVVRLARRWLAALASRHTTQGMVNRLLEEFDAADDADFGCAWDDLRRSVRQWALDEGWIERPAPPAPRSKRTERHGGTAVR
jgi:hypothetical protein